MFLSFTHVECDGDDVKAHRRVRDAAEGGRLVGGEETRIKSMNSMCLSCVLGGLRLSERAHPVYFGHFVSPSAALVSAHQLRRGALFSGAAESATEGDSGHMNRQGAPETQEETVSFLSYLISEAVF